jgi:hypothetical protein
MIVREHISNPAPGMYTSKSKLNKVGGFIGTDGLGSDRNRPNTEGSGQENVV